MPTVMGWSNGPLGVQLGGEEIIALVVFPTGDAVRLNVGPDEQQVDEGIVI